MIRVGSCFLRAGGLSVASSSKWISVPKRFALGFIAIHLKEASFTVLAIRSAAEVG
jgi:hypothetical protein